MVHANGEITLLVAVHDELLDGASGDLERLRELSQGLDEVKIDGLVHLGKLLEETGEDNLLEGSNVLLHLLVGANLGQNRRDLLANRERMEINLEDIVK